MVLFRMPQRYTHLITTAMPAKVTATKNLPLTLMPATPDMYEQLARQVPDSSPAQDNGSTPSHDRSSNGSGASSSTSTSASQQHQPVHLFPEGGLTNGKGMLQFSRGFMKFAAGHPVVPVALKAKTPFGIRTHTLNSSFLANLFWFSLCPWVEIEATVLPTMQQQAGEGRGVFVQRVQQAIADELRVPVSELNIQQKRKVMQQALKKGKRA